MVSAPLMMIPCNFSQLEESEAKCAEAQRCQQTAALELENLHTEMETLSRSKTLVGSWRCGPRAGQVGGDGPTLGGGWQQSAAAFAQSATTRGLINHLEVLFTKFTKSPRIFTQSPRTVWKQQLPGVSWVDKIPAREQRPMVLLCLSDGLEAVGSTSQRGFAGFPVGSMSQRSRGSSCRWTSSCSSCSTREPTC